MLFVHQALLLAHDKIANKEYPLQTVNTSPSATENQYADNNDQKQTVSIKKGNDPLVSKYYGCIQSSVIANH